MTPSVRLCYSNDGYSICLLTATLSELSQFLQTRSYPAKEITVMTDDLPATDPNYPNKANMLAKFAWLVRLY